VENRRSNGDFPEIPPNSEVGTAIFVAQQTKKTAIESGQTD
jgi:hypothetical protein